MVVEEHMVCVAFNRMYCATYWFNPNILLHEKHYSNHSGHGGCCGAHGCDGYRG